MGVLIVLIIIVFVIIALAKLISLIFVPTIFIASAFALLLLIYKIYESFYFKSNKFLETKKSICIFTENCNELNFHIEELKRSHMVMKSPDYGDASMKDESNYNFQRTKWEIEVNNTFVYNCSSTVCKSASNQPIKYLCKYFGIDTTEDSLLMFEHVLNNFAAAEQGKLLLKNERDSILIGIESSIPWAINSFGRKKLIKNLGFEDIDLSDLYFPVYEFQYVSAGGNSSMKCEIKLDVDNLDKLISYLREKIKFKKSIAGQRALMTSKLREKIKIRDDYTCQICGLSTSDEKNLLLEIDHIIPLSKAGITSEDNLQTLCWKCNRTKGAKIYSS